MKGCVIGKIDATTYANIFTSESKEKNIYLLTKNKIIYFLHFIDAIL